MIFGIAGDFYLALVRGDTMLLSRLKPNAMVQHVQQFRLVLGQKHLEQLLCFIMWHATVSLLHQKP